MKDMTVSISGSVKIYVVHNVLGGFAPATAAAPLAIPVEIRVNLDFYYQCEIKDFYRALFLSFFWIFLQQGTSGSQYRNDLEGNMLTGHQELVLFPEKFPDRLFPDYPYSSSSSPDSSASCLLPAA